MSINVRIYFVKMHYIPTMEYNRADALLNLLLLIKKRLTQPTLYIKGHREAGKGEAKS